VKDQFDAWRIVFPTRGEHPVVLISHPDRCARAAIVSVLYCTSQRQSRKPHPFEVMLDSADGMDWETFCDCSHIYSVESSQLFGKRGHVTLERRRTIRAMLRDVFLLSATN
jgi:mRNA-degrading endonuclease toxin of MazEF toxin-antitoxin module